MTLSTPPAITRIGPQPGPQETFLSTPADIAIYGGAAGGGKTWALLMEPLRHIRNPGFGAVFFRRTKPQIENEGGLWDESEKLYPLLGGAGLQSKLQWRFPSGARVRFCSLQHEKDKLQWQGSQIPLLCFDELTHFSESQFFYFLSRTRSMCGVRPYIRCSTNPDALSWVKVFLAPWIDKRYPDPAASGEVRWFIRDAGNILWVPPGTPDAKSVTFVRSSVYDNRKLLEADPDYLANLKAMSLVDRARLLDGDWDIVPGGNMFRREWFRIVPTAPAGWTWVRVWDLASTEVKPGKDPDWTAGALVGVSPTGEWCIADMQRERLTPAGVEKLILQTAHLDRQRFGNVQVVIEQEPGSSGVTVIHHYVTKVLNGFDVHGKPSTGNKADRAKPLSAQAEVGNVSLVSGLWNNDFLNECCAFPSPDVHDDQVDATSGAFERLAARRVIQFS